MKRAWDFTYSLEKNGASIINRRNVISWRVNDLVTGVYDMDAFRFYCTKDLCATGVRRGHGNECVHEKFRLTGCGTNNTPSCFNYATRRALYEVPAQMFKGSDMMGSAYPSRPRKESPDKILLRSRVEQTAKRSTWCREVGTALGGSLSTSHLYLFPPSYGLGRFHGFDHQDESTTVMSGAPRRVSAKDRKNRRPAGP